MRGSGIEYKIEIDNISKDHWYEYLKNFNDANIYQTWAYGKYAWKDESLSHFCMRDKSNNVVCMAQLGITKVPFLNVGIATIYWGPLWQLREGAPNVNVFTTALEALRQEYSLRRGLYLRIYPYVYNNNEYFTALHKAFLNREFKHSQTPYKTLLIKIDSSLDKIRKGFVPRWRTDLNRSERNNLDVIEGINIELYNEFQQIYNEMLENKHFLSFADPKLFKSIQNALPDEHKINIIVSRHEGVPIAAALTAPIGLTGLGIFWASNALGRKMCAAYQLQWKTIEMLKTHNCIFYDIGGIDFENNPGSYRFKTGLAGKNGEEVSLAGRYDICDGKLSNFFVKNAEQVKIIIRKFKVTLHKLSKFNLFHKKTPPS
jgi:lipid II:glycine glycyltransferase (peptidoglycan interpeptide bridge formation enzyme)